MKRILGVFLAVSAMLGASALEDASFPPKLMNTIRASQVDVIYHLALDARGDAPVAGGLYCPGCNTFHDRELDDYLADHRDLKTTGYVVAERTVLAPDLLIAPGGAAAIEVRFGQAAVPAKVVGIYPDTGGLRLELEKPLPGAKALTFVPADGSKYFAYSRIAENGEWVERLDPYSGGTRYFHPEMARESMSIPGNSLILDPEGRAVALFLNNNEINGGQSWNRPWTAWREISPEALQNALAETQKRITRGVVPVTVQLGSAKLSRRERLAGKQEREEIGGIALMLPDGKIFLPFLLTPEQHSRIEKILLRLPGGAREAKVAGAMRHFGGLVLTMADGRPSGLTPIASRTEPIAKVLGNMAASARLQCFGRKITVQVAEDVLFGTMKGYRGHRYALTMKKYADGIANALFSVDGDFVALDVALRLFNYERKMILMDAGELEALLNDPAETVPLAELSNPLNAVALLGVEYQALSPEVAQSEEIAHLTRNGREGLFISYVYPGSPAATLGLKPGDVLLKIILPDGGAPIELSGKEFSGKKEQQFPWEKLDAIPERYFSDIPEPWPGIKDPLNLLLTRIGIGEKVRIVTIQNHALRTLNWTIAAAPAYYDVAPEYRSAALGVTVRDVTFELRRFFRLRDDAPGVMVADVAAGSPAATAGLRPFEMITAVNDTPVRNVREFEAALAGQSSVRLAVRRLAASRVVTVALPVGPRR